MADRRGPLVVACLSPADLRPEVDRISGEVLLDQRRAELSAQDAAALEHALRATEAWAGSLVVMAAGGVEVEPTLREAAALGAEPWRVSLAGDDAVPAVRSVGGADLAGTPERVASALAGAIKTLGPPALVMCGDRSPTLGVGAVPALLAHHLQAAQALGLVSVDIDGDSLVAIRRLDAGWREQLRVHTPAVCSVEAAGTRLRRAPLPQALAAAADTSVHVWHAPPANGPGGSGIYSAFRVGAPRPYQPRTHLVPAPVGPTRERLLALTGALVAHDPPRLVGPIDPAGAADELLSFLARHGYWDGPPADQPSG